MKKIYEDDFVIAVDTEDENNPKPIMVMYSTKVVRTSYETCLDECDHNKHFTNMILAIVQNGREKKIYKEQIYDCKDFIERWCATFEKEDNEYFEQRKTKYEKEIKLLDIYERCDLTKLEKAFLEWDTLTLEKIYKKYMEV